MDSDYLKVGMIHESINLFVHCVLICRGLRFFCWTSMKHSFYLYCADLFLLRLPIRRHTGGLLVQQWKTKFHGNLSFSLVEIIKRNFQQLKIILFIYHNKANMVLWLRKESTWYYSNLYFRNFVTKCFTVLWFSNYR